MMEHTKEPWVIIADGEIVGNMSEDLETCEVVTNCGWEPEGKANARRIVLCVNACAGISKDYLEAFKLKDIIDDYQKAEKHIEELNEYIKQLEAQLEELQGVNGWSQSKQSQS